MKMDRFHLAHRPVVGSCQHSNKPLGSTKGREIIGQLSTY